MEMISSHPFIAPHFHPFIVWVRVYRTTEGKKILNHCTPVSTLVCLLLCLCSMLFISLTAAVHSELCFKQQDNSNIEHSSWKTCFPSGEQQTSNWQTPHKHFSYIFLSRIWHLQLITFLFVHHLSVAAQSLSSCRIVNWFDISCLWPKEKLSLDEPTNRSGGIKCVCVCRCVAGFDYKSKRSEAFHRTDCSNFPSFFHLQQIAYWVSGHFLL